MSAWLWGLAALGAERFALVTSASEGGAGRTPLRHSEADAERMASVLLAVGGIEPQRLVRLTDPEVSEVRQALAQLGEDVREAEHAEIIVYFTGHADQDGLQFGASELPYRELRDTIDAMDAEVRVVVIDGCSSGAILRQKGGAHEAPLTVDVSVGGVAYLTSSAADEVSQESDQLGGSFFTHSLAAGLRGAADRSADGQVTLAEAYQYAYASTLALTERTLGGAQHASFDLRLAGAGDVVLTRLDQAPGRLVLPPSLGKAVTVLGQDGRVVAELAGERTREAALAVAPGTYSLLARDGSGLYGTTLQVGQTPRWVDRAELMPLPEPATRSKGARSPVRPVLLGVAIAGYGGALASWMAYSMGSHVNNDDASLRTFFFFGSIGVMSTTTLVVMPREQR